MTDAALDALAQMARNRGLKLVRSRVRTPGKDRFGKAGLADPGGKAVFGMDKGGPRASPEEVQDYLRKLEVQDWGASLGTARVQKKKRPSKAEFDPPLGPAAVSAPPAKVHRPPEARPAVRKATPSDAARLVALIHELGTEIDEKQVRNNLAALHKSGDIPLVATLSNEIVGLCGIAHRVAIHRPAPLGRITVLVVAKAAQGKGIGRMLVEAAENWMRKRGCYLVEVTSNDRRAQAHAFYRHMGYERTSIRFAKQL